MSADEPEQTNEVVQPVAWADLQLPRNVRAALAGLSSDLHEAAVKLAAVHAALQTDLADLAQLREKRSKLRDLKLSELREIARVEKAADVLRKARVSGAEIKSKLSAVLAENKRLHLQISVEKQLSGSLRSALVRADHPVLSLLDANPLSKDEIIAAASPWTDWGVCGVYFLIKDRQLVYVGQSKNVPQRLLTHHHRGRFDSVCVLPTDLSKLDTVEWYYINLFRPPFNRGFERMGRVGHFMELSTEQEGV